MPHSALCGQPAYALRLWTAPRCACREGEPVVAHATILPVHNRPPNLRYKVTSLEEANPMHNLHFVGVVAESGDEALTRALYMIEDWGTEDNWRVGCGAITADGTTYDTPEGRWSPTDWLGTPDKIRAELRKDIAEKLALQPKVDGTSDIDDYIASQDLKARSDARWTMRRVGSLEAFDPFDAAHEYRPGVYDQFGVTHFDDELEGKRWLVLIDMHS